MKAKESFGRKCGTFLIFAGPAVISFVLVVIIPMIYGVISDFYRMGWFHKRKAVRRSDKLYSSFSGWSILEFALAYR